MLPFTFKSPTSIYFGEGTANSVPDFVKQLGGRQVLVVTDNNLMTSGLLRPVFESLEEAKFAKPVIFDNVPPDSDVDCVNTCAQVARKANCDCIVAVGGGSVMDTAKAVNICLTFGGEMLEYQGLNNLPHRLLPLVAIPTTCGTGAEVSLVAMVKVPMESSKILFGSQYLAPDVAVLDPRFVLSLPAKLTAATAFDALTHDLEAYVAQATGSIITDSLALESMRLVFCNLLPAIADSVNLEARSALLVASTMAGLAFTNAGVGIVHAMAHAIGGRYGTHHGMTNAVLLPWGMEFNIDVAKDRYAQAARFLQVTDEKGSLEAANTLIAQIRNLLLKSGLPNRLRDLGVSEISDLELHELADLASTDPAIMFNPKESTVQDIIDIYKRAY